MSRTKQADPSILTRLHGGVIYLADEAPVIKDNSCEIEKPAIVKKMLKEEAKGKILEPPLVYSIKRDYALLFDELIGVTKVPTEDAVIVSWYESPKKSHKKRKTSNFKS